VLVDTHTADGLKVAAAWRESGVPMVVLETALPAKFAATVQEAVGFAPEPPPALRGIESLPRRFVVMPPDVAQVKQYILDHAGH
jgi:threonine synthase